MCHVVTPLHDKYTDRKQVNMIRIILLTENEKKERKKKSFGNFFACSFPVHSDPAHIKLNGRFAVKMQMLNENRGRKMGGEHQIAYLYTLISCPVAILSLLYLEREPKRGEEGRVNQK